MTAVSGAFLDFVVDIRVGSPTFGQWENVRLDEAAAQGLLPNYDECLAFAESLRRA